MTIGKLLDMATEALIYGDTSSRLREALITLRDNMLKLQEQPEQKTKRDYAIELPERTMNVTNPNRRDPSTVDWSLPPIDALPATIQVRVPAERIYVLDGNITTSKIYAIKYVRGRDNVGLKEAKDYVDSLYPTEAIHRDIASLRF
jgi:hypothetical protein